MVASVTVPELLKSRPVPKLRSVPPMTLAVSVKIIVPSKGSIKPPLLSKSPPLKDNVPPADAEYKPRLIAVPAESIISVPVLSSARIVPSASLMILTLLNPAAPFPRMVLLTLVSTPSPPFSSVIVEPIAAVPCSVTAPPPERLAVWSICKLVKLPLLLMTISP